MLPQINPAQFIPANVAVSPLEWDDVNGNMPLNDITFICRWVAHLRPRTVFEIGTFRGVTTYNLAKCAAEDAVVYTLDLPPSFTHTAFRLHELEVRFAEKAEIGEVYRRHPESRKIVQLQGDSALFDFSRYAGLIDFVLVDASHTYANCLSDSLRAITLRSSRGVIAWHDYNVWPGVTAALDDLHRSADRFGSLRSVAGTGVAVLL